MLHSETLLANFTDFFRDLPKFEYWFSVKSEMFYRLSNLPNQYVCIVFIQNLLLKKPWWLQKSNLILNWSCSYQVDFCFWHIFGHTYMIKPWSWIPRIFSCTSERSIDRDAEYLLIHATNKWNSFYQLSDTSCIIMTGWRKTPTIKVSVLLAEESKVACCTSQGLSLYVFSFQTESSYRISQQKKQCFLFPSCFLDGRLCSKFKDVEVFMVLSKSLLMLLQTQPSFKSYLQQASLSTSHFSKEWNAVWQRPAPTKKKELPDPDEGGNAEIRYLFYKKHVLRCKMKICACKYTHICILVEISLSIKWRV